MRQIWASQKRGVSGFRVQGLSCNTYLNTYQGGEALGLSVPGCGFGASGPGLVFRVEVEGSRNAGAPCEPNQQEACHVPTTRYQ